MYDILRVSSLVFEMVSSLEMYVIYCMMIVETILPRLRLWTENPSADESINEFASTTESIRKPVFNSTSIATCNVENLGVHVSACRAEILDALASLLYPDKLIVCDFSGPMSFIKTWLRLTNILMHLNRKYYTAHDALRYLVFIDIYGSL
jgi:hypothetical protein